jgi:thymidylate synthase
VEITVNDLRWGYVRVCRTVMSVGVTVMVRGQLTRELTGVTLAVPDPSQCMLPVGINRGVNTKLAAVETLGMIAGQWPHDLVLRASPHYTDVLVDTSKEHAATVAYGPRTWYQLGNVLSMLRDDPTSRQAVVTIWDQGDLTLAGDKPCTLVMQFLLRHGKLELHVTMRSQDVWLGLAMDVFLFTQTQLTLAGLLGVAPGKYVHHVGSLHAYQRNWDGIAALKLPNKFKLPLNWPVYGAAGVS